LRGAREQRSGPRLRTNGQVVLISNFSYFLRRQFTIARTLSRERFSLEEVRLT
jgi:hypothetical protein